MPEIFTKMAEIKNPTALPELDDGVKKKDLLES